MKLRKPRLYLRDLKGAEGLQAYYLVYYDHEGNEKRRSLSAQIYGQPFPKTNANLAAACRVQAERILAKATMEILTGNVDRIQRQIGMKQPTLLNLFDAWSKRETDRNKSVTINRGKLERWTKSRSKKACHLTEDDIYALVNYLEEDLDLSRTTALRYLRDVRHVLEYGVHRGYCTYNAATNVKPRKKPRDHTKNDTKYLDREQLQTLLATPCQPWVRESFLLMLHLACGPAELCQLRWDMIEDRDGREMLVLPRAKNRSHTISRWVDELQHVLPERQGEWILPNLPREGKKPYIAWRIKLNRHCAKWGRQAGLNRNGKPIKLTSYIARRTAATAIQNDTNDLLLAARAIGHVNTQHTHRYARHDDEQRATVAASGLRQLGL
jgi:integrase